MSNRFSGGRPNIVAGDIATQIIQAQAVSAADIGEGVNIVSTLIGAELQADELRVNTIERSDSTYITFKYDASATSTILYNGINIKGDTRSTNNPTLLCEGTKDGTSTFGSGETLTKYIKWDSKNNEYLVNASHIVFDVDGGSMYINQHNSSKLIIGGNVEIRENLTIDGNLYVKGTYI